MCFDWTQEHELAEAQAFLVICVSRCLWMETLSAGGAFRCLWSLLTARNNKTHCAVFTELLLSDKTNQVFIVPKNFKNNVSSVTACLYFCLLSPSVTTPSSRWPTTVTYWCTPTVSATGYLPPSSAPPAPSASSTSPSTGRTAHSSSRKELELDSVVFYLVCSFM